MYPPLIEKLIQTGDLSMEVVLNKKCRIYTFLNPVSYLEAIGHENLFCSFDGIFADGSLLVKGIKIAYSKKITRRSSDMTSIAPLLFEHAENNNKTVAIIASHQEEVEKAVENIQKRYPSLKISFFRNGYFNSDQELETEVRHILDISPDFLIIGMGIVLQEKVLKSIRDAGFKGIGFTCGGFMHQLGNTEMYYPRWIDKLNIRFLYRMYKEPHTRKRYAQAAFLFPYRFFTEKKKYK